MERKISFLKSKKEKKNTAKHKYVIIKNISTKFVHIKRKWFGKGGENVKDEIFTLIYNNKRERTLFDNLNTTKLFNQTFETFLFPGGINAITEC